MKSKGTRQGRVRAMQPTCCFAILCCGSRSRAHVSLTLQPIHQQLPPYMLCMSGHVANLLSCHIHQTNILSSQIRVLDLRPCYDVQSEPLEQVAQTSAASELCIFVRQLMTGMQTPACVALLVHAHWQSKGCTLFGVMPSARGV